MMNYFQSQWRRNTKVQDSNTLPPRYQTTASASAQFMSLVKPGLTYPLPIPLISLQPNPKPPPKPPHIPHREQRIRILQRYMSSSGHRGSDLRLRNLQLSGHSPLPLQGVPAAKLDLVKDVDREEEEDLGQSYQRVAPRHATG